MMTQVLKPNYIKLSYVDIKKGKTLTPATPLESSTDTYKTFDLFLFIFQYNSSDNQSASDKNLIGPPGQGNLNPFFEKTTCPGQLIVWVQLFIF